MNDFLPAIYLSFLVALLAGTAIFIVRQILRTRKTESRLSQLQNKLKKEKGTAQEYYELGTLY